LIKFGKKLQSDYAIPPGLIKDLEELFPNKCPDLKDTDREVWFKSGQASVIEFLKMEMKD
tara:strand:+ start:248 stop:427 length:180 start_codon:yes stop_codon:yes gene_type:complete